VSVLWVHFKQFHQWRLPARFTFVKTILSSMEIKFYEKHPKKKRKSFESAQKNFQGKFAKNALKKTTLKNCISWENL